MKLDKNQGHFRHYKIILVLISILIPVSMGFLSVAFGKDINWDLRNYHYYNAYAFLEDRLDYDIAPAQLQTYTNPILDIPFYILSNSLSSSSVGFIFAFIQGMNLLFILFIILKLINSKKFLTKIGISVFLVLLASTGPGFLAQLGGAMNDNFVSLFILSGIYLLILASTKMLKNQNKWGYIQIGAAGIIIGMGVGLKMSFMVYALSSGLFLPLLFRSRNSKIFTLLIFGFSGILGFLMSNGFWMWRLYSKFGNPLFPHFNQIFKSSAVAPIPYVDTRFFPKSIFEYVFWPIISSIDSLRVSEVAFSDCRFLVLYILILIYSIYLILNKHFQKNNQYRSTPSKLMNNRLGNYLIAFFICSYIIWMLQFSIYRYLIPLELLAPVCILVILDRIISRKKMVFLVLLMLAIFGLFIYQPSNWERSDWSDPYIEMESSMSISDEEILVIMLGYEPTAYVIPDFPDSYRFIRPTSNLLQPQNDYNYDLMKEIEELLENPSFPMYVLYSSYDQSSILDLDLDWLRLDLDNDTCIKIITNISNDLVFCEVKKIMN